MNRDIDRPAAVRNWLFSVYIPVYTASNRFEPIWKCFKTILLNQEMNFKKNPIEKYFFIMEKNDLGKKFQFFFREISIFQLKNQFFQVKFLLEKIDFSIEKIKISRFFLRDFFSKSFFSMMKKYFSMGFFFKSVS